MRLFIRISISLVICSLFFCSCETKLDPSLDLKVVLDEIEVFAPGFVSTGLYERDFALDPNEKEFTVPDPSSKGPSRVVRKKRAVEIIGKINVDSSPLPWNFG